MSFEKEHKYKGTAIGLIQNEADLDIPKEFSFDICISPDKKLKDKKADQTGCLYITLPLPHEKAKHIAHIIAHHVAQKITFEFGEFSLYGGFISGKRIPETPEEEIEIGENLYFAELKFVEAVDPPTFDSKMFSEISNLKLDMVLVSQHNAAKKATNPVDKFLGFFKILESRFSPNNKIKQLGERLKNNRELFKIYENTFRFETKEQSQKAFEEFIDAIVHARHRCAHLKANKGFGYTPIDPRLKNEVEPYLALLEILTYETIMKLSENV